MQARGWFFAALLLLPAFAGCTIPGFDRVKRWDLEFPLGVLVSQRAGAALEDVGPAAELAARQLNTNDFGVRYTIVTDSAPDNVGAAFDRLAAKRVAAVVAAVAPDDARVLVQRAAAKKIPLLLVTPPNGTFSATEASYLLAVAPSPDHEARALADLVTDQGVDSVLLFRASDAFMSQAARAFRTAYAGNVVEEYIFEPHQHGATIAAARAACARSTEGVVVLGQGHDAGWIVLGLEEGGCRTRVRTFAGSEARQNELVVEAGLDGNDKPHAAGVMGVEPAGARLAEFGAIFDSEYGRAPGYGAAAAYDAVTYATLAGFFSKSSPRADPVRAKLTAANVQAHLLAVAEPPGVKHRDVRNAVDAAKLGDEFDWVGYAHDYDFSDGRLPVANAFDTWRVTPTGGVETVR